MINDSLKQCNICKNNYTSTHIEVTAGVNIYACPDCLEKAKHNFIFICMDCSQVYFRPKQQMIERIKDYEMKRAYMLCEDMQLIQGLDMCIQCNPDGIIDYIESNSKYDC